MKSIIIHHSADFDGLASGEVCKHFMEYQHKDCDVYGWDYGEPVPIDITALEDVDFIYMVDISIDAIMESLARTGKLIWIDHHKSAIEKYKHLNIKGFQLDGVAACRLSWQWFLGLKHKPSLEEFKNRAVLEPYVLRLLGEYDIWDHRDPCALPLQYGLKAMEKNKVLDFIQEELASYPKKTFSNNILPQLYHIIAQGKTIQSYVKQQNLEHAQKHSYKITLEGLNFLVLNTGSPGNSQFFDGAWNDTHDALLAWRWDGKQCYISFYHRPGREDLDLSTVAVKYGGGGHKGACGMRCSMKKAIELGIVN